MDSVGVSNPERSPNRILAVADWSVDPRVVARALRARSMIYPTVFSLLVPSRLPGLDWVGNPNASRPCATQRLAELEQLCRVSNVSVATASVGDPERLLANHGCARDMAREGRIAFRAGAPRARASVASPQPREAQHRPPGRNHRSSVSRQARPRQSKGSSAGGAVCGRQRVRLQVGGLHGQLWIGHQSRSGARVPGPSADTRAHPAD
jgi:hypothetical protein